MLHNNMKMLASHTQDMGVLMTMYTQMLHGLHTQPAEKDRYFIDAFACIAVNFDVRVECIENEESANRICRYERCYASSSSSWCEICESGALVSVILIETSTSS